MAYNPQNANGQTTAANSSPVVLASDQTAIPPYYLQTTPANLAIAPNSASTINTIGTNSVMVGISTTATGSFIFEATSDGSNWYSVEAFDIVNDLWVSGTNITPTQGRAYCIVSGGKISVRLRVTATLGATVAHTFYASNTHELLAGIDTGAAPHNFGYTLFHKDAEYTTAQTSTILRTTTSGKKFAITDLTVSTDGTTAGVVTIYDASGTTAFTAGTTPSIFRSSFAPSSTVKPGAVKTFNVPYVSAAAGNNILVTITGITTTYIQINGYEI